MLAQETTHPGCKPGVRPAEGTHPGCELLYHQPGRYVYDLPHRPWAVHHEVLCVFQHVRCMYTYICIYKVLDMEYTLFATFSMSPLSRAD